MTDRSERVVLWTPWDEPGLEHLRLRHSDAGASGDGWLISTVEGRPYRFHYIVTCDAQWRVRELRIATPDQPVTPLHLCTDGSGNWTTDAGDPIPALTGCTDVDFRATPFTNTLPIRRLHLEVGASAEIRVVYVDVPDLRVTAVRQRYTCLTQSEEGARYRYESLDGSGFTAELPTDTDGLMIDYPGLFRRVPLA